MYKLFFILYFALSIQSVVALSCDAEKQLIKISTTYHKGNYHEAIGLIEALEECDPLPKEQYEELLHLKYKCFRNLRKGKSSLAAIEELRAYLEANQISIDFENQLLLAEAYALRRKRAPHQYYIKTIEDSLKNNREVSNELMGRFLLVKYYGYEREGAFGDALTIAQKALSHFQAIKNPPIYYKGNTLRALGNMARGRGDLDKAVSYYHQELDLYKKHFSVDHFDIAVCHYNLGGVFYDQLEYQRALDHYLKAHKTWSRTYQSSNRYMKMLNEAIGDMYWELEDHEKALYYFNESIIEEQIIDNDSSSTTLKVADSIFNTGSYSTAINYYKEAFIWRKNTFGNNHILTGSCKNFVARAVRASGDSQAALLEYQEAITILVDDIEGIDIYQNPTPNMHIRSYQYLLESLIAKGELLGELYTQTQDRKDLLAAFQTHEVGIEILEEMKKRHMSENSKTFWTQYTRSLIENGIAIAIQLFEVTGEIAYLDKAFVFSEKSKALLLLASLENSDTQGFVNVPSSLIKKEKELKTEITLYLGKLESEEKRCAEVRVKMLKLYREKLQALQNDYDLLLREIAINHPKYYDLKFETKIATLAQIRASLINEETALVSYFLGIKNSYVFYVTEVDISVRVLKNTDHLINNTLSFFNLVRSKNILENTPQESYLKYVALGHQLYTTLLQPEMANSGLKNLIIVPEGMLSYLPFEILLTEAVVNNNRDYKELPYLLRQLAISYAPSATVQIKNIDISENAYQYLGFAPSYQGVSYNEQPNTLANLSYNTSEVDFASQLFNGQSWTGDNVTEEILKNQSHTAGILHLAMHGEVEDTHPLLSKLYFNPSPKEDGMLHTYEIYNLDIPAQLVILSACNTATGKLVSGEGILSLERAFQYAGSKALVSTLWSVDDASSAKLNESFLSNLKEGQPKGVALQQAKLQFLNATSPNTAHPYYWGSFKLTGSTAKISEKKNSYLWASLIVLGILFTAIYLKKKRVI